MNAVERKKVLGLCLRKALEDAEKDPARKLMMGAVGKPGDTAHFWTEGTEGVLDRASSRVPKGYAYEGRQVDPEAVLAEIAEKTAAEKLAEVTLDINKGDILLGGKYKNSPITVEEIGTDELGQPTVNGRKLLAYRIKKKMPQKTAAAPETTSQKVKEDLRHILMGTVVAPAFQSLGTAAGAAPFARALKGVKDSVTPEDVQHILAKVNEQRIASGMKPTSIVGSVSDTAFGKALAEGDTKLNERPGLRRVLKLIGKDPGGMLKDLENSPGFQMEIPGMESSIYRSPKATMGATGTVLTHELGHASPQGQPGARMSAFGRLLAPMLLGMGAGGLGHSAGRKRKVKLEDAALAGAGALGTGHMIREEMRASRFAKEQLKALGKNPAGLKRALMTYVAGTAGGVAATGGAGYLLGKVGKKEKKWSDRLPWKKQALEKVAKFMISKGPDTAAEYLEGLRKLLAAKALEKAPAEVAATAKKPKKPSALAKLIKKKKKSKPLYGQPTGHGTAAFRFGD